jgi:hypothetical protein
MRAVANAQVNEEAFFLASAACVAYIMPNMTAKMNANMTGKMNANMTGKMNAPSHNAAGLFLVRFLLVPALAVAGSIHLIAMHHTAFHMIPPRMIAMHHTAFHMIETGPSRAPPPRPPCRTRRRPSRTMAPHNGTAGTAQWHRTMA